MTWLRRWTDPFIVALLLVMIVGIALPVPGAMRSAVDIAADVAVTLLFLLYGMRLETSQVRAGLGNVRLQGAILAATYLVFPVVGFVASWAARPLVGDGFADGIWYATLVPSTVQSSVAFTSLARGNTAGAVCGATLSNILGMALTPLLVLALLSTGSGRVGIDGMTAVVVQLLVPFLVGQALQPRCGRWIRSRRWLTVTVDRSAILIVVFAAVTAASAAGLWRRTSVGMFAIIALVSCLILALLLAATWWGGAALRLDRGDRIALLMCGSKKSLASGLPMASALFPAAVAGTIVVPVIVFHQIQLLVCAVLARRLARPD